MLARLAEGWRLQLHAHSKCPVNSLPRPFNRGFNASALAKYGANVLQQHLQDSCAACNESLFGNGHVPSALSRTFSNVDPPQEGCRAAPPGGRVGPAPLPDKAALLFVSGSSKYMMSP